MSMHNPPHPGEFIEQVFLSHLAMSRRSVALKLGVAPSTFVRLFGSICAGSSMSATLAG